MAGAHQLSTDLVSVAGASPGRRSPGAGLLVAILVSAAVHVALIWFAASPAGPSPQVHPVVATVSRIEVRLAEAGRSLPALADSESAPVIAEMLAVHSADSATGQLRQQAVADAGASEPRHQAAGRPALDAAILAGSDGYLPRSVLTKGPVPIGDVQLPWPVGMVPVGREAGTFWLFVDESGTVRRFESDGPTLAPRLEEVARSVFLSTRFVPGERDGQVVRSLIQIEVVFDNRPLAAPAAKVVSEQIL